MNNIERFNWDSIDESRNFVLEQSAPEIRKAMIREGDENIFVIHKDCRYEKAATHYLDIPSVKSGYYKCDEVDCVLCATGIKKVHRGFIPLYNMRNQEMESLMFTFVSEPKSLYPQLKSVIARGVPVCICVIKAGFSYTVTTSRLREGIDYGESAAERFTEMLEKYSISLTDILSPITDEIVCCDSISNMLNLKGLDPRTYLKDTTSDGGSVSTIDGFSNLNL